MRGTISRLSSGLRIQSAADDAAGMAVAENMRAQLRGFQQAQRNANDGAAMLHVAEAGYQSITDILVRLREIAVQAANDSISDTERAYIDTEFQSLRDEIDRVGASTEYNGIALLDGGGGAGGLLQFQVGTRNSVDDRITIQLPILNIVTLTITGAAVDNRSDAADAIEDMDQALDEMGRHRAVIGATLSQLNSAVDHLSSTVESYGASVSGIRDTDMAAESARFAQQQVMQRAGVAMVAQANARPRLALRLLG